MGFNRLYDRITQLRVQAECNLEYSQRCACRILPGLFSTYNIPILVNE